MFGGLEVKGSSSKPAANGDGKKEAAPTPAASSAFSFLSGAAPAPASASSNDAPAAPSAFSFMSSGGSSDKPAAEPVVEKKEASSVSSAFSFLSQPAADDAGSKKEPSPEKPAPSSAFNFLSTSATPAPAPADSLTSTPAASTGTGFSFMSSQAEAPKSDDKVSSLVSSDQPAVTESKAAAPAKAPDSTSFSNPHQPLGSGIKFGGAISGATKKPINRRRRTQKIGAGASASASAGSMAMGGTSASVPAPSAMQQTASLSSPAKPPSPAGGFVPPSVVTVPRETSSAASSEDAGSTADAALEAARRAEEFMQEKKKSSSQFSAPSTPPSYSRSDPTSPQDEAYAEAKAAALEAKAQMATTKKQGPGGGRLMRGLFNKGWGREGGNSSERNSSWSTNQSSKSIPEPSALHNDYDYGQTTRDETPAERIQREQEEISRAVAERTLAMKQQQEQQKGESPKAAVPVAEAPPPKPPTPPPPKKKTPEEKMEEMIQDFSQSSSRAMDRVAHLRQQRQSLLDERTTAEKKLLLATQQISQAEAQQTVAVEEEEFDLADRLGAVMDKWEREKRELSRILENIDRALKQLNEQRNDVVGGVAACFKQVQEKLTQFQEEQENTERTDDTKAMQRFAAISKQLSTENDRLVNDLKHIERDEALVAEERSELNHAIGEHTASVEKQRADACQKLQTVQDEIEELRERLAAREAVANQLLAEVKEHDAAIAKVKLTFNRQITRVQRKEASVKENRIEWNAEQARYEKEKEAHEAEVKAHSEALLSHDELMERLKAEITLAETFEKIVAKEVGFESAVAGTSDDSNESEASELVQLQTKVVEGEAAVAEAIQRVQAAEAILEGLDKEHKGLIAKIPFLETQKKSAAARRDFKAASKANKEIKDATARLKDCEEELAGEGTARVKAAKEELEQLQTDLEQKKTVLLEKEKEEGVAAMSELAKRIKGLILTKKKVCGGASESSVQAVGAVVLNGQIKALQREGEVYGAKFGGWEDLMNDLYDEEEDDSKPAKEANEPKEEEDEPAIAKKDEKGENANDEADDAGKNAEVRKAKMRKFKKLTQRLKDAEEALEAAVEREDYDEAAELDVVFQEIQTEVEELGLTDAEMDEALTEAETNVVVDEETTGSGGEQAEPVERGDDNQDGKETAAADDSQDAANASEEEPTLNGDDNKDVVNGDNDEKEKADDEGNDQEENTEDGIDQKDSDVTETVNGGADSIEDVDAKQPEEKENEEIKSKASGEDGTEDGEADPATKESAADNDIEEPPNEESAKNDDDPLKAGDPRSTGEE